MSTNYKELIQRKIVRDDLSSACDYIGDICHGLSNQAGWWEGADKFDPNLKAAKMMLMVSELSEAMEGMRKDILDDHLPHRHMEEVELADAIIRIFDYAGAMGMDIGGALSEKLLYNCTRKDHQKENRESEGGKKI